MVLSRLDNFVYEGTSNTILPDFEKEIDGYAHVCLSLFGSFISNALI